MLEQKLIVGRRIHFQRPNWPGAPPAVHGQFVRQHQQLLTINESTGVFTKTSNITAGAHGTKPWRTFGWLSWLPGAISECHLTGNDVLTGPMSGCDLVLYRRNGVVCAGHLGTDVGAVAANAAVKLTWNNFAQNAPVGHVIGGFNPFNDWVLPYPVATGDDVGAPTFYGLYTTAHTFYTLVLFQQKTSTHVHGHPTLKRIAAIRQINSKNLHQLQHL